MTTRGGTTGARTMRAIVQDTYGTADTWRPARVPRPVPAGGEVLVRVHAAGIDRGTWHLMTGRPFALRLGLGFRRPRNPVPGRDVAGTVEAVGPGVTAFSVGDEVYGTAAGSLAEYAVADQRRLAPKPGNLSYEQAAVIPVSGGTALQALCDVGHLRAGQSVLITGASGGVGSFAVQLAKALDAEVTGACSTGRVDFVRSLGADHVVDRSTEAFGGTGRRYDLILDIAGNPSLSELRRALTPAGTAVIVGGEEGGDLTGGMNRQLAGLLLSPFVAQRVTMFVNQERGSDLERLTELVEAGKVTPRVDRVYRLEEAPEAMRELASGRIRGKVAVCVVAGARGGAPATLSVAREEE